MHKPGDLLDVQQAIAFQSARDGSIEVWSFVRPFNPNSGPYFQPSRDGRLFFLQTGQGPDARRFLIRRDTGEAFEVSGGWVPDISVGSGNRIGAWQGTDGARFGLLDVSTQSFIPTDIDRTTLRESSRLSSPDGRMFVVGDGSEFRLVDMATGKGKVIKDGLSAYRAVPGADLQTFTLIAQGPGASFTFDWQGNPATTKPDMRFAGALLTARPESPGQIVISGLGAYPAVEAVTLLDSKSGEPRARLLGATFVAWSADGSALMVTEGQNESLILEPSGKELLRVPGGSFLDRPTSFSPTSPDLVVTNRGIVNFHSGVGWTFSIAPQMLASGSWLGNGNEAIFSLGVPGGKDGGVPVQLFPYRYQPAPFDPVLALRVNAGSDCLNLRAGPGADSAVVACLPSGTGLDFDPVLLSPRGDKEPAQPFVGQRDAGFDKTWLHVRAPGGQTGWASAEFLDWAD
jgi:hypothetical protein